MSDKAKAKPANHVRLVFGATAWSLVIASISATMLLVGVVFIPIITLAPNVISVTAIILLSGLALQSINCAWDEIGELLKFEIGIQTRIFVILVASVFAYEGATVDLHKAMTLNFQNLLPFILMMLVLAVTDRIAKHCSDELEASERAAECRRGERIALHSQQSDHQIRLHLLSDDEHVIISKLASNHPRGKPIYEEKQ